MSDPYADALGIKAPEVSSTKIAPALQKSRDGDAIDILHSEHEKHQNLYAGATTNEERVRYKADVESSKREIKALGGTPKTYAEPAPLKDPYAAALGVGGPAPTTQQIAASNVSPANVESKDTRPMTGNKGANQVIASPGFDLIANQATSLGSTIAGGYAGIYKGLKTLIKTGDKDKALSDAVSAIEKTKERGTFEPKTQVGQQMVDAFGSKYNPLQWPGLAAQAIGDAAGDALENSDLPAAGAVAKGVGAAAPLALGFKGVQNGFKNLNSVLTAGEMPKVEAPVPTQKPAYRLVNGKPELIADGFQVPPVTPPIQSRNVAPSESVPTTFEGLRHTAQNAPGKLFPETPTVAPAGGKFSASEQAARANILQSVGVNPANLRKSAVSGDALSGSTDYQTAKLDSPAGRQMRSVIDQEKTALSDHSDGLVKDTGGTHGIDQSSLYARGNSIIAPLDGLKKWFDEKTSSLYKAADEQAQGVPTQLSTFKNVLDDASELTNSDRVHFQSAINSYAKKLEMVGEDGTVSGSAKQAETIRKYLNEHWSPQNSKLVGKLKDALDEDVTRSAGADIYAEARSIRTLRANTLDNPNGIAKIMDASGPEGINRAVPVEKIADHVTGMPLEQFSHVVGTLKNLPPEMQGQAAGALSEIKAHFANRVNSIGGSQQGQWNAKGVTQYLQNNAGRMAEVFTPEEIAKFRNLNDAGHIVAKDQSYPGAAVQGHNLMTHGVMFGLQGGGAALGSMAGPVGAAVGGYAGRAAASAVGDAAALRAVKKRMVNLSDLVPTK